MEKKVFTKFEKARIKRTAQNVDQYVSKKKKLVEQIAEKQAEVDHLQQMIDLSDAPIKLMTGGYGVEDLVRKVVTPTDKLDKNGNIIKNTNYELIYPETVVPPVTPDTTEPTEEAETTAETVEVEPTIPGEELISSEDVESDTIED